MEVAPEGATLDVPGAPRVIHVPGHTEGSAALLFARRDAICVGDAVVTRNVINGGTGPQLFPNFNSDNERAYASLARLDRVGSRLVLTGHGDVWDGGLNDAVRVARERWTSPRGRSGRPSVVKLRRSDVGPKGGRTASTAHTFR